MKMDIYDLMYGLNDVSDYIVMETQKKSPQLKERAAVKWCALAACVCLVFGALLYSGIMNGRHGTGPEPAHTAGRDTDGSIDSETSADTDDKGPGTVDLREPLRIYPVDWDKLAEYLTPYQKENGRYEDGMQLAAAVIEETYNHEAEDIRLIAHFFTEETDGADDGDRFYIVNFNLDGGKYEFVEMYDSYLEAERACGICPIYQAAPAYDYFVFADTEYYKLYRDEGTANLKLLDKLTDKVTTIHEWNGYDDGAARGFGEADGGFLLADKYVFFTLVTPDYDYYGNDYIDEAMPDEGYEEKNYVYVIETGELKEFTDDYEYLWGGGNVLYLYKRSDDGVSYYCVDMTDGLNENVKPAPFFDVLAATQFVDHEYQLTSDGKYYIYLEPDYRGDGGGADDGTHVFNAYDTEENMIRSVTLEGFAGCKFRRGRTVYGEDVYVCVYVSEDTGDIGIAVFDLSGTGRTDMIEPPAGVVQIGDFKTEDGVLIEYTGTDTEPVIPDGIIEIGAGAFESSPAAGSITKITLGRDVRKIDDEAFYGLGSLLRVAIGEGNSAFVEYEVGYSNGSADYFICAVNRQQVFYFRQEGYDGFSIDNEIALSESVLYSYKEKTDIAFNCGNAKFEIFYESGEYGRWWYFHAAEYEGNRLEFDEPVEFAGANLGPYIFETADHELVFGTEGYNGTHIYYMTKDQKAEAHSDAYPGYAVSFYRGDDGEMRYLKIKSEYSYLEQTGGLEAFFIMTSRDEYYGEDGRVYYEGGEFRLEPEEVYTISDYFVMNGKDIDTMFEENFGEDYESLEELMAHNAERGEG